MTPQSDSHVNAPPSAGEGGSPANGDPMVEVLARVASFDEHCIRRDERRRWSRLLRAHDADGNFVELQRALATKAEKRAVAWLLGSLREIVDAVDAPDPEPYMDAIDGWLRRSA